MPSTIAGPIATDSVVLELAADTLTPVSAALRLGEDLAFLLESVEEGVRYGRFSFLGVRGRVLVVRGERAQLRGADGSLLEDLPADDPLEALRAVLPSTVADQRLPIPLASGVGYLAYEVAARWERLPVPDADPLDLPEALFHLPDAVVIFDHLEQVARVATLAASDPDRPATDARLAAIAGRLTHAVPTEAARRLGGALPALDGESDGSARGVYRRGVAQLVEEIRDGEMLQAVLARRFSLPYGGDPFTAYRALRRINPSPYLFYVDLSAAGVGGARAALLGASPELLVRVHEREVVTRPIAGTRPRSGDPVVDAAREEELRRDEKELAEHAMLVDLARNDVGRVADPATVSVPMLRSVEHYSHVMHLVSEVRAQLRDGLDAFDALRATFPAGTVSGAPKLRAMESVAALEGERRGPYGGGVGFFSPDDLEAAITIRGAVVMDGVAHVHAGAGIVADSQPEREADEVDAKARAMRTALADGGAP